MSRCPADEVPRPRGRRAAGSVLVVVSWLVLLLGGLAVAISALVSARIEAARRVHERVAGGYLARAGAARALAVVVVDTNGWDDLEEDWKLDGSVFQDVRLEGGMFRVWHTDRDRDGRVVTNYGLIDEESRISINLPRENGRILQALFEWRGLLAAEVAAELAASVMDWKDEDTVEREGGAERAYYLGLPTPYVSRDGLFGLSEELLLVKGMHPDLYARVAPHITVHGQGRVNLNTAGAAVLEVLAAAGDAPPDVARSLTARILDYRAAGLSFRTGGRTAAMRDAAVRALERHGDGLTAAETRALRALFDAGWVGIDSSAFRGRSEGWVDGRPAPDQTVEFVIDRPAGAFVSWRED